MEDYQDIEWKYVPSNAKLIKLINMVFPACHYLIYHHLKSHQHLN
jgi:hypothetical protein